MESLLWWELKGELNYVLLVWTDYQNEQRGEKKVFNPQWSSRISVIFHYVMMEAGNSDPAEANISPK